jgi:(1->4)-alpha-D-glucan 1-alpha-D-glucosylmutase
MAKGVEDTAFYCFSRLLALNEVGGDPGAFGVSVQEFHAHCLHMQETYPNTMLASSTHDTKRGEDVRARLVLLSEWPDRWQRAVQRMAAMAERYRSPQGPDRETEYLLYQTLVGAWPIDEERLFGYLQKAVREAKVHSWWQQPNEAYEAALQQFVRGILVDAEFRRELEDFVAELRGPAERNALAQLVLKLTAPGVPDIYQGTEVFRYDLTDPDNRRKVDYPALTAKLKQVERASCAEIFAKADADLRKLYVTHKLLALRREHPESFSQQARYWALPSAGAEADRILAFGRGSDLIVVVPRLSAAVGDNWGDTHVELPAGSWRDALCGELAHDGRASELFSSLPVAVLVRIKA